MFLQRSPTMTSVGIISSTTKSRVSTYSASWWRHQMETFSALLVICAWNSPVPCEFPTQRPVTRSFDVFFDLHLNKRLSKQSWGWWYETLSHPLWRHCNECFPFLAIVVRRPTRRLQRNWRVDDPPPPTPTPTPPPHPSTPTPHPSTSLVHSLSNGCNAIYICRNILLLSAVKVTSV